MDGRPGAARSEDPDAAQPDPPRPRSSRVSVSRCYRAYVRSLVCWSVAGSIDIKLLATITSVLAPLFV